jgi:serine/threonine-protein kinase HipA
MAVPNRPGILGIFLRPSADREVRVGTMVRDATGVITFEVDDAYVRLGRARPLLSLTWHGATEKESLERLAARGDKITHGRTLPPYFDNLLPEGALLDLVEKEFGTGSFDNYDVLARLGGDLPGAVVARREAGEPPPKGAATDPAGASTGKPITFSLAGVQMKFSMHGDRHRLTAPGANESGDVILKLPSEKFSHLVENEYTSLALARLAGSDVSEARLVEIETIEGIPPQFQELGRYALSVKRFDRASGNVRIHTEDFAQLAGAVTDEKYWRWNQETILRSIRRFSDDPVGDTLEGLRRLTVDILLGNCDGHLKNWSFVYPDGRRARLSPAYDIVSTLTYLNDTMALRFSGSRDPRLVDTGRLRRLEPFLEVDLKVLEREMRGTVTRALDMWPAALKDLPAPDGIKDAITSRFGQLALVREVRPSMVRGHVVDGEPPQDEAEERTQAFRP